MRPKWLKMRGYIGDIHEGKLKSHQINGSLSLGNIIVHLPLPQLMPYFDTRHQWMDNFGLPYQIELRFGTQDHETYQEGNPIIPCQSNRFQIGKVWVKVLGQLKSHTPQNPVKLMNNDLGINRYTLLDILNIVEYSHGENQLIKGVKKNNPCQGDKVMVLGKLGLVLGSPFGRLLRGRKEVQ